jgi:hypothetical protein
MAAKEQTEFVDGFSDFPQGFNSGVAAPALPKTQLSYSENTTVRGRYVTHRPAYQIQTLNFDTGVSLSGLRLQGACYYKPDFGAESIVAQIGGRVFQFVPDTMQSASVYDRTIRDFFNGANFTTNTVNTTLSYSVQLMNVNDASGASYPAGTVLTTDPAFLTSTTAVAQANPVLVDNNTKLQFTLLLPLPAGFNPTPIPIGSQVFLGADNIANQVKWTVTSTTMTIGGNPALQVQFTTTGSGSTIVEPIGTPIFSTTNPSPPAKIATTNSAFTAPGVGQLVTAAITTPFPGTIGQGLLIGGFLYVVISIPQPAPTTTVTTQTQTTANNSTQFSYDQNPAGIPTAWLWQTENYVVIQDGQSRPVIFNGVSSRRSITPTFVGTNTESFSVPQIGQTVTIELSAPFQDAVGTYIQVSALNLFAFLLQVIDTDVGDNPNVVTAVNINGQTAVGAIIPITSTVNSTSSPIYSGVMAGNIPSPGIPAPGTAFQISVSPPYMGVVGDDIILTDGTGSLTAYTFSVTAIQGGGSSLTVTNVNAPTGTVVQAGYPIVSQNTGASELPIGRMGAYVQGRNWISSPDGTYFIASDQEGDSTGTQALNYRDAVLKWSINTTKFPIPGGAGEINCIVALGAIDASLGQGPLQILCDNQIFTCSAPNDETTWASTTTPILPNSIIGFGGVGQGAAVVSNSDLILKSGDGTIHSLKLARQDFNQWGNLPISQEVNRIIAQENINQLFKITETIADNRALVSCAPIDSAGGIYSQGLIALDFDVTSSLQGKLPSVYDGVWKDLNFLQLISGKFNKIDRTFVFNWNTVTNTVELWEILKTGTADNGTTPITWSFESPMLFNDVKGKGEFDRIDLQDGRIFVSDIVGEAKITVWYRPDFSKCWHLWHELTISNTGEQPGYSIPIGLGQPNTGERECTSQKKQPAHVGRFFQTRIEVVGSLVFQGLEATATPAPEPKTELPVQGQTI